MAKAVNISNDTMQTTTEELIAANDAIRAEFPNAIIVDAAFGADGFRMMMMPANIDSDTQIGKGATITDAMADLRKRVSAADPILRLRKQAEAAGYTLTPKQD